MNNQIKVLFYFFLLFLLFPKPTFAYLDPGTGSYIFQILIAGLLGSVFFLKSIIRKIKEIFKNISPKKPIRASDENK